MQKSKLMYSVVTAIIISIIIGIALFISRGVDTVDYILYGTVTEKLELDSKYYQYSDSLVYFSYVDEDGYLANGYLTSNKFDTASVNELDGIEIHFPTLIIFGRSEPSEAPYFVVDNEKHTFKSAYTYDGNTLVSKLY